MQKIKTVFKIDYPERGKKGTIRNEVNEGCEWVLASEGWPEIKLDGTACLIKDGILFKRYDAKHGKKQPPNFFPCMPEPDEITGHWPGWVTVGTESDSKWHINAFSKLTIKTNGTYELIGRHIKANPYNLKSDYLVKHGFFVPNVAIERTFEGIRNYLEQVDAEGLVFHHADGRMAKIRRNDYGFDWPIK